MYMYICVYRKCPKMSDFCPNIQKVSEKPGFCLGKTKASGMVYFAE